jgi:hypothetical protein
MRKIVGMKLHDLPAGWTVGSLTVDKPDAEIYEFLNRCMWLSMLTKPTGHNSIYHVLSWEDEQNRMYDNWQHWLEGIIKNA